MKLRTMFLIVALSVVSLGASCNKEQAARDAIATNYGWIITAQRQNQESCQADATQAKCGRINQAISIHNIAIDAFNVYCAGPPKEGEQSYDSGGPCSPQAGIEPRLQAAIRDLDAIVADIKSLVR